MTNAATYERISLDLRDGAGVARQHEDNLALAERRGWRVVAQHHDNDTSASGKVKRPGFEALLAGLTQGRYSVVVAWSLDRLTRNRRDTVRLIEAAQAANATIALVRGSDLDLSTPAGRLTADILASVARSEIEQKSDRQKRANRQAAEAGKPYWRVRPFGYTVTGEVVPEEASAIQDGHARILGGQTLADVARDWNARGLTGTRGKRFVASTVRQVLVNPANAAILLYDGTEHRGAWEPITSESTFRAVRALLDAPERAYRGSRKPTSLLAGLATCAHCGGPLYTDHDRQGVRRYRCKGKGFSTKAAPVDEAVIAKTAALLTLPGILEAVHSDSDAADREPLLTERRALVTRRDVELPAALAAGLSVAQIAEANRQIVARLADIEAQLAETANSSLASLVYAAATGPEADAIWRREVWDQLDLAAQRVVVRDLWVVTVSKGRVEVEPTPLADRLAFSVQAGALLHPESYGQE